MTTLQDAPAFDQARYDEGRFDGCLEIIDPTGDTKIIWDKDNPDEVAMAEAAFDQAVKSKMSVFTVKGKDGAQDKRIDKFDAKHERLIAVPQMAGG
jgi:hypothetical protein